MLVHIHFGADWNVELVSESWTNEALVYPTDRSHLFNLYTGLRQKMVSHITNVTCVIVVNSS